MQKATSPIHIFIGLCSGLGFALLSVKSGWPTAFTINYIKPLGTIFLNSLKMIAIPLIFTSLVAGVTSIKDIARFSRIGRKAFSLYTGTTVLAVVLGLTMAHLIKPGRVLSEQTRDRLMALYASEAVQQSATVQAIHEQAGPLQFLVDLVPENILASMSNNVNLLQVVFAAMLLGIALLKIPPQKSKPVILFFAGLNDAMLALVRCIMHFAPIGVFALVASLLIEVAGDNNPSEIFELLHALMWYVATTMFGLALMTFIVYPIILRLFTKVSYIHFLKSLYPAQLVAFTTSSSAAALPVTMERVEKHLGIPEEISSFVLPLGATINMDGSALYQGITIAFIAQALGLDLSITAQLAIATNVALSSIGVAGVPGGAVVMTTMLLQSLGIPAAGLALILAPDRILDMCRTVTNITGDAAVAVVVASSERPLAEDVHEEMLDKKAQ